MQINEFLEPFDRMLEAVATPSAIRAIEGCGSASSMWQEIAASGFLDAMIPHEQGGAGLSLREIEPLVEALGARAIPLPVSETIVARALLRRCGAPVPEGPIVLATEIAQPITCGLLAEHVLLRSGNEIILYSFNDLAVMPTGVAYSLSARFSPHTKGTKLPIPAKSVHAIAAVLRASLIAGAAARLCEMTTAYASARVQFGKPIGNQQAVQHMLAVMAEDMIACRIAAQLAAEQGIDVTLAAAAMAKITTSAAAPRIAASAHAVHGAIGISEEYDLHLLTRRLHEWRLADGSEGYWSRVLGDFRLQGEESSVNWMRENIWQGL